MGIHSDRTSFHLSVGSISQDKRFEGQPRESGDYSGSQTKENKGNPWGSDSKPEGLECQQRESEVQVLVPNRGVFEARVSGQCAC